MSAIAGKADVRVMSASPPKADINGMAKNIVQNNVANKITRLRSGTNHSRIYQFFLAP